MKTQEVPVFSEDSTMAKFYLIADYSTTAAKIPILQSGGCWAQWYLHNGIRYVSTPSIPMELQGWRSKILNG